MSNQRPTPANRAALLQFLGEQAAHRLSQLPSQDRIRLYEALALVLPKDAAKRAEFAAYAIRTAEQAQLDFASLLN